MSEINFEPPTRLVILPFIISLSPLSEHRGTLSTREVGLARLVTARLRLLSIYLHAAGYLAID